MAALFNYLSIFNLKGNLSIKQHDFISLLRMILYFETAPFAIFRTHDLVKVTFSQCGVPTIEGAPWPGAPWRPEPSLRTHLGLWKGGGQGRRRPRPDNVLHSRRPRPITARRLPAPLGATGHGSGPRKPGLWAAIWGHPGAGRAELQLRPARRRGPVVRAPRRPLGTRVAHGGQDAPPIPDEHGAVPLRRASSRGREERLRPRRGGQRHPGYRAGDDYGPSGSSQSLRDARLAAVRERGWGKVGGSFGAT